MSLAPDEPLLRMLAELNRVAAEVNRAGSDPDTPVADIMRLIAEGVVALMAVAGRPATAVIYILDVAAPAARASFVPTSRVAAGVGAAQSGADVPRPHGLGSRALERRQRVLSYEEADLTLHEAMTAVGARVGVCYPLIVADQPVAALYVYLHEDRPFGPAELLLLDNFVNLAAMALHRKQQLDRVHRHLERKEEELARLRRADLLISSRVGLQETLESILQMALEVTGAQYGILRVVDPTGKQLVTRAIAGADLGRPATEALPINTTSITGWVAKYRRPLCIPDVRADPWARIYYPLDHDLEMRSELAVPLIGASGRLEGVVNLESPRPGAFSEDDSLLLQSLATQAVIAIQEVRLLDALQEIAEGLLTRPPQQVFDRVVELACELLNVPVAALWVREEDELILQSATRGHRRGERVSLRGSLTGQAVVEGRIVTSEDVRSDPRFQWPDLARSQGWTQAIVVPLTAVFLHVELWAAFPALLVVLLLGNLG
ncbi:MAG: GAF domain-containing protein, partial [Caldilineales bacterium]|nr:GAF domain-containing protein [Caldilineales bacterium]